VRTLRLLVAYDGTAYRGFGIQPMAPTIQGTLEQALAATLGHQVRVTPGGRTDSGVHAQGQVVSLRTSAVLAADAVRRALNARLPEDILVRAVDEAPSEFDARRSALWRRYRYTLWREAEPNLWWRRYSYHVARPLDLAAMRRASRRLRGRHDFAAFATHQAQANAGQTTTRTLYTARWRQDGGFWHFDVVADAFLRHMVRSIVGTLLLVGRGDLASTDVGEILEARDRRRAGPTAPAHGLTLMEIAYPSGALAGGKGEANEDVFAPQSGHRLGLARD
jgi:tRNA pseudouridine38-40 synthase